MIVEMVVILCVLYNFCRKMLQVIQRVMYMKVNKEKYFLGSEI